VRSRFPVLLALILGAVLLPVVPGWGPHAVPTRVQTLALDSIGMTGGRGMSGVDLPTAARSAVVETDPFGLVGLSWDTPPPEGSMVKVRVREQAGWTPWMEIPFSADHGPDPDTTEGHGARSGTDPMLTGESDAVQVWVQTPDGQAPANTEVHLVDTDDVDVQPVAPSQAAAAPGMPPIVTRAQWGADESKRKTNGFPQYGKVVKVGFVHHTVSSSTYTQAQAAAQVRNLYAWYTEGLKYSDMAYNFLVDRFGRLYEGRYGGMDRPVVGGHTAGLNNDSFAVSAMGNFDEFNPAAQQMSAIQESISRLLAWKLGLSNRDPGGKDTLVSNGSLGSGYWEAGEVATLNRVSGHRDAGNTACPGKHLYAKVPDIRARAAQIYRNGPGTAPPEIPDLITPDQVTDEFSFRGSGNGDGVGVPRAGVLGQARDGKKASGILKHYLAGVEVAAADDQRILRVNLANRKRAIVDSQALGKNGGAFRIGTGKNALVGNARTKVRLSASGDGVVLERKVAKKWRQVGSASKVTIRWAGTRTAGRLGQGATSLRVGADLLRRGTVTVSNSGGTLRIVGNLRVHDEYLPYLQTAPSTWPEQAQRTMAVIARSKALAVTWDSACGCHVNDTGFVGQRATTAKGYQAWRKAVRSTSTSAGAGLVVLYQGAPVDVPLFDATGGATLNASDVWGQEVAWLRSATDPWSLRPKNSSYATWSPQTRPQADVAALFGLPDVVLLDLRTRLTGGAVAKATATSSTGQTAAISGEKLRTGLQLPSAYIARSATQEPTTATSLSTSLARGRRGGPVVVQASDTTVVALAAAFAGSIGRPLYVVAGGGPDRTATKALRPAESLTAVGAFHPRALKALSRLAKVRRVTAGSAPALSLELAQAAQRSDRRTVFVAAPGNASAMASAAMGAVRAHGYLLVLSGTPSAGMGKWVKAHGSRTIVVAAKKEISNAEAAQLRKPVRLGAKDPVVRAARIAGIGSRRGDAILVDSARVMAAAAAAASGRPVLFVNAKAGNTRALRFLQASPAISSLRSVGAGPAALAAARLA